MSEHDEIHPDESTDDVSVAQRRADLVARAHEASAGHPELVDVLERLDRLEEMDLAARPAELDSVHRVLREALMNAGRPGARA